MAAGSVGSSGILGRVRIRQLGPGFVRLVRPEPPGREQLLSRFFQQVPHRVELPPDFWRVADLSRTPLGLRQSIVLVLEDFRLAGRDLDLRNFIGGDGGAGFVSRLKFFSFFDDENFFLAVLILVDVHSRRRDVEEFAVQLDVVNLFKKQKRFDSV